MEVQVLSAAPSVRNEISGHAAVAELVDALASGASSRKGVEVQVLSAAPPDNLTEKGRLRRRCPFLFSPFDFSDSSAFATFLSGIDVL